jgi:hypothetical protein
MIIEGVRVVASVGDDPGRPGARRCGPTRLGGAVAKATLAKGSRISGAQRSTLATQYAKRYTGGESIRTIAEEAGRSYGFVHNVLKESGVTLRGRGGATRGAKRTVPPGPGPTKAGGTATKKAAPAKKPAAARKTAKKAAGQG